MKIKYALCKNSVFFKFLLCGVYFTCPTYSILAQENDVKPISIILSVEADHSIPVNLKKYGVNGALLWSNYNYGDNELATLYEQIGISFSRFPGGTIGNFYNWKTGRFSCYKKTNALFEKRISGFNRRLNKTNTRYSINDFVSFIKKTGGDFTYVVNTMCETPKTNAALFKFMKASNVMLSHIEMSNEVYSSGYDWAFEGVESYLKSVEVNYLSIKDYYPDVKVGLVISPISFNSKQYPEKNGMLNNAWPKRLKLFDAAIAKSMHGDALIIHLYGNPYKNKIDFFGPETNKEHYLAVMGQFNKKFGISIEYLKLLGNNKPIWVTEWGVTTSAEKRHKKFKKYKKSNYQALFMASVLTSISLEKSIEIANYHILSDMWNVTERGVELSPIGKVLEFFLDVANKADNIYKVNISPSVVQNNKMAIKQDSGIKSLLFVSKAESYLFLINEQDRSYLIDTIKTENSIYSSYSVDEMFIKKNVFLNARVENKSLGVDRKLLYEIKPFSISRIKLQ